MSEPSTTFIDAMNAESVPSKAPAVDDEQQHKEVQDPHMSQAVGKVKMTHAEKEAARIGWRSEVQEIPKQVRVMSFP